MTNLIMKKIISISVAAFIMMAFLFTSCKKDYITGGSPENVNIYKDSTTYDVLKGNPMYDTLVQVIDAAGLKEKINAEGTTFFAPNDNSILQYLEARTLFVQQHYDQNAKFALDSLKYYLQNNINGTRDSLLMYQVNASLTYSALNNVGKIYPTSLTGDSVIVSFEQTTDGHLGYTDLVSQAPQIVYFTQLWDHYDISKSNPASKVPDNVGVRNLVKTSGIVTKNGILNLLDNSNKLFFYDTKQ
jgi:hypothetical protein